MVFAYPQRRIADSSWVPAAQSALKPGDQTRRTSSEMPAGITWPAPKGIVLANLDWIADIALRHSLNDLTIPAGSIVLERISATGGRCFCYPDGSWLIGLSRPRLQRCGRRGVEGIVAHELLHAWLWSHHLYRGHGSVFEGHAAARGIPRWCSAYREVRQLGPQQMTLFDTWPAAPEHGY